MALWMAGVLASVLTPPARAWRTHKRPTTSVRSVWKRRPPLVSVRAYDERKVVPFWSLVSP
jgi:hypothetical protein